MNKRFRLSVAAVLMAALSLTTVGATSLVASGAPAKMSRIGDGWCC